MQTATTVLEAIGNCIISDLGRLESRMMRKYQVRFGGGLLEKGPSPDYSSRFKRAALCVFKV